MRIKIRSSNAGERFAIHLSASELWGPVDRFNEREGGGDGWVGKYLKIISKTR